MELGHLQSQFIHEDSRTYLKGKYPSDSGTSILIELKQVPVLLFILLQMLAHHESDNLLYTHIHFVSHI